MWWVSHMGPSCSPENHHGHPLIIIAAIISHAAGRTKDKIEAAYPTKKKKIHSIFQQQQILSSSTMTTVTVVTSALRRRLYCLRATTLHSAAPKCETVFHSTVVLPQWRCYFTNADRMKQDDPYALLGLQWGDATSTAEIKEAFRKKARELHPDVNTKDTPEQALQKFQKLQKAYQTLLGNADDAEEGAEEWRFAVWRTGDRIAQDRTDVAGEARKRPAQPASKADAWASRQIGHPDGRGVSSSSRRNEFLGTGKPTASSVGRGLNKWVTPKDYKPWDPEAVKSVRASNFAQEPQKRP